jgi:hypothetical protein
LEKRNQNFQQVVSADMTDKSPDYIVVSGKPVDFAVKEKPANFQPYSARVLREM